MLSEYYRLRAQEDETAQEIRKTNEIIRDYETRLTEITRKT